MNKLLRAGLLTAFAGVTALGGVAQADEATTSGGLKIKTDDGKFEFGLGGRIHFDAVDLEPDSGKAFGSSKVQNNTGTYFRRVFLTLNGSLYGFQYRVESNIAGNNCLNAGSTYVTGVTATGNPVTSVTTTTSASANCSGNDFQDVWILKTIKHTGGFADGFTSKLWLGQHKPWRSMEELGSNNETLFMERPVTSASGIYGGRDFQQGEFYSIESDHLFFGQSVYALHKDAQQSTQGVGYNARAVWAPLNEKGKVASFGASYSSDHADNGAGLNATYRTAGYRLGTGTVTQNFGSYTGSATGGNSSVDTLGFEGVGILGPVYLNGEYQTAIFSQEGKADFRVNAYYVQSSWFITGESKTFGAGKVVGSPKVSKPYGALEAKVRYEFIENANINVPGTLYGGTISGGTIPAGTATKNQFHDIAFGLNYYINPAMRVMFDYILGTSDFGSAGKDKADTIAARFQLAF